MADPTAPDHTLQASVDPPRDPAAGPLKMVFIGLSITSSWGNGHATTYRSLLRALRRLGHDILFLERDRPWYATNRDLPSPAWGRTVLYRELHELRRFEGDIRAADLVVLGSYVPDGVRVAEWLLPRAGGATAFYDIDTPVTLDKLARGDEEYMAARLIPRFDMYLSFTGGPILELLQRRHGAPRAHALYCSVDPDLYQPAPMTREWDLGYLGTYSEDRHAGLERLLLAPARALSGRRFVVAGPGYPPRTRWPENVGRIEHLPPREHRRFYNSQRFTLNLTRREMRRRGWSPSVRLFEAAACGTAIVTDRWPGLETILTPGEEVVIAEETDDVVALVEELPEEDRRRLGERARERVLRTHTAGHRARELEEMVRAVLARPGGP